VGQRVLAFALLLAAAAPAVADYTAGRLAYERGNFIVALLEWRSLAERDDARAKLDLARMYFYGQAGPQDIVTCERMLREAADGGSLEAQHLLGVREGRGDRGLRWLRKAVENDDVMAQYFLAARLRSGDRAIELYHGVASRGIIAAQLDLGRAYLLGRGVTSDPRKTESWWRRAAESGSAVASLALAQLYYSEAFERRDVAEAARWFRIAAERGETLAQLRVSMMYYRGEGLARDRARAYAWARMVPGDSSSDYVATLHAMLAATLSPEEVAEGQRLADQWLSRK